MTEVYIVDSSKLLDAKKADQIVSSLSGELYFHIKRKKTAALRAESLAAYLALGYAAKKSGRDFSFTDVTFDENSKPHIKGDPFFFSVSHSGRFSVCAISDGNVGVDIEESERVTPRLSRRFLGGGGVGEWTRREAKGKFTGRGFTEKSEPEAVFTDYDVEGFHITVCATEKAAGIYWVVLP